MLVEQKLKEERNSGFTLIELLIVTVVIVALMGILFRLTGIAGSAKERETTVYRMQCLENCLSGYYAAFGSYPQVPLQGRTRNIFRKTHEDRTYVQSDDPSDVWSSGIEFDPTKGKDTDEYKAYLSVEAACRAQSVAAMYPPPGKFRGDDHDSIVRYRAFQQAVAARLGSDDYSDSDKRKILKWIGAELQDISGRPGFLNPFTRETSINQLQLFRFGLMSFLLPRFRFMLGCAYGTSSYGGQQAFNNSIDEFAQWTQNNTLPPRLDSGVSYASWKDFCDVFDGDDDWQIDLIPSQAACARWMPNLSGNVVSGPEANFFGVTIALHGGNGIPEVKNAASFNLYFPGGYDSNDSRGYPLLSYTVRDGWGHDFYYYSPAPYQSYVLWSAGANGWTFPPWVDLKQLSEKQLKKAVLFMSDDIKHMSTGK